MLQNVLWTVGLLAVVAVTAYAFELVKLCLREHKQRKAWNEIKEPTPQIVLEQENLHDLCIFL